MSFYFINILGYFIRVPLSSTGRVPMKIWMRKEIKSTPSVSNEFIKIK